MLQRASRIVPEHITGVLLYLLSSPNILLWSCKFSYLFCIANAKPTHGDCYDFQPQKRNSTKTHPKNTSNFVKQTLTRSWNEWPSHTTGRLIWILCLSEKDFQINGMTRSNWDLISIYHFSKPIYQSRIKATCTKDSTVLVAIWCK